MAHILTLEDQLLADFFLDSVDPGGYSRFWIGLTDMFSDSEFYWEPGHVNSSYRNWRADRPVNDSGYDFVRIDIKPNSRQWVDSFNEYPCRALCQVDLTSK